MCKRKFVFVPQKCYAFMSPETDSSVFAGLCAEGTHVCSGVVVNANKNKYIFLCHADSKTNLFDEVEGLPAWIRLIQKAGGTIESLEIYYDASDAAKLGKYPENIRGILQSFALQDLASVTPVPAESTGVAIFLKSGRIIRDGALYMGLEDGDYREAPDKPKEPFEIQKSPLHTFIGNLNRADKSKDQLFPPICVFAKEHMLAAQELFDKYPLVQKAFPESSEGKAMFLAQDEIDSDTSSSSP